MTSSNFISKATLPVMAKKLSHIDDQGQAGMVDVGDKDITKREATAQSIVQLPAQAVSILAAGGETAKGNVLSTARIAGIMAAKRTHDLIPLCHPLPITGVDIAFEQLANSLRITATVRCRGQTGVEMEALTAASLSALTVYDMLKALSHDIVIERTELVQKRGGRSGTIQRTIADG